MGKKNKTDIPNIPLGCPECKRLGLEQKGIFPYYVELNRVNDGKDQVTVDADGTTIKGTSYMISNPTPSILVNFSCYNDHRFQWGFIRQGEGIRLTLQVIHSKKNHEHEIWM